MCQDVNIKYQNNDLIININWVNIIYIYPINLTNLNLFQASPLSIRDRLTYNVRVHLAKLFDAPQLPVPDWRSLALYLGFTHSEMAIFDQTNSPTLSLLTEWEKREMSTTIRLKDKVKLLECTEASELLDSIQIANKLIDINESLMRTAIFPVVLNQHEATTLTQHIATVAHEQRLCSSISLF